MDRNVVKFGIALFACSMLLFTGSAVGARQRPGWYFQARVKLSTKAYGANQVFGPYASRPAAEQAIPQWQKRGWVLTVRPYQVGGGTAPRPTAKDRYFLVLCARGGSSTGHALVLWVKEDQRQRATVVTGAYGFYPSRGIGLFGAVPGEVRNEALKPYSHLITHRHIVEVDQRRYEHTQQAIHRWATRDFHLMSNNCINFVMDVAARAGLRVPAKESTTLPGTYLQMLIRANQ